MTVIADRVSVHAAIDLRLAHRVQHIERKVAMKAARMAANSIPNEAAARTRPSLLGEAAGANQNTHVNRANLLAAGIGLPNNIGGRPTFGSISG